jgi:hypothetical protein
MSSLEAQVNTFLRALVGQPGEEWCGEDSGLRADASKKEKAGLGNQFFDPQPTLQRIHFIMILKICFQ